MTKHLKISALTAIIAIFALAGWWKASTSQPITGAPPYAIEPEANESGDAWSLFETWKRPIGPARVGLQVGHWKNEEVPEELKRLLGNTGASGGGKAEWEVNYAIASHTEKLLEAQGIIVDILPTTVPKEYWADVFLAIHADGNLDSSLSGFKFAHSWRDYTGNAAKLVSHLDSSYAAQVDLPKDPAISRNMRGYYAFAWWRFEHAIHPMTAAAIAETGFLTNKKDQKILIETPEIPAQALAKGITDYLREQSLI
jgi:N-acetylmuramoyl-L-alanine amidase